MRDVMITCKITMTAVAVSGSATEEPIGEPVHLAAEGREKGFEGVLYVPASATGMWARHPNIDDFSGPSIDDFFGMLLIRMGFGIDAARLIARGTGSSDLHAETLQAFVDNVVTLRTGVDALRREKGLV